MPFSVLKVRDQRVDGEHDLVMVGQNGHALDDVDHEKKISLCHDVSKASFQVQSVRSSRDLVR
jgi:hypothetical protein